MLEYHGHEVLVRSEGPKPDTFRDRAEVVAKGTVVFENGAYVVEATELSAKCPSKYQGATRTKEYGAEAQQSGNSKGAENGSYGNP
jgi:cytochrome c-type biogenesis protein CcmE